MMDNADTNVDSSGFGFFENAHLWAGRAWYSGLVGVNDGVNPLRFDWVPLGGSDPERENFGRRSFQSAGGVYTQVFGQQLSDWKDRVITGFCINGTKTLEGGDVLPLFLWAKFRTYRPELRPK